MRRSIRRLALVLSELRPGGMERVVVHLASSLRRRGIEPLVVCLQHKGPFARELEAQGITVVALNSVRGYDLCAVADLARAFRRFRPELINVHDRSSLPYAVLANLWGAGRPVVFTAHGLMFDERSRGRLGIRIAARVISALTAVSREVADRHVALLGWRKPAVIVPNGVPDIVRSSENGARIRRELNIEKGTFVFLAMGNARPEKDFVTLLDAAAQLQVRTDRPAFYVLIAGRMQDARYAEVLKQRHADQGLRDVVRFLGFRADADALYAAADAFVLSSRSEGLPMVILEAMISGLPVIATRVGGVPEVIGQDRGLLVDRESPEQLVDAMRRLAADVGLRETLGRNARAYATAYHSVDRMTEQYLDVFQKVV